MKLHYFEQQKADPSDTQLQVMKQQKVVPENCLLNGIIVMVGFVVSKDPCKGCMAPRNRCGGRPR